jgi:hypothetical protein
MKEKKDLVISEILDYFNNAPEKNDLTIDFFYNYLYDINKNFQEMEIYEAFSKLFKDKIIYFSKESKNTIRLTELGKAISEHY